MTNTTTFYKAWQTLTGHCIVIIISQLLGVAVIKLNVLKPGGLRVALHRVDTVTVWRRRLGELCALRNRTSSSA